MYEIEEVCGNCVYWNQHKSIYETDAETGLVFCLCPCDVRAIESDSGLHSCVMLAADSHCHNHDNAFEPKEEELAWAALQHHYYPLASHYGVTPGMDFPGMM